MTALLAPLREAATYRSLLFLASAIPLGTLCVHGPRRRLDADGGAPDHPGGRRRADRFPRRALGRRQLEALLARELLGANAVGSRHALSGGHGFWGRTKATIADVRSG